MARRRLLASGRKRWYEKDFEVDRFESIGLEKRERFERCTWRKGRDERACVSACVRLEMQLGARVICIVLTVPFCSPWLLFIGHFLRLRVTSIIDKLDLDVYGNGHILAATLVFSLGSRVFNIISALRPKFPWNSSLFFKLPLSYSYTWNPHRCYRCSFEPLV